MPDGQCCEGGPTLTAPGICIAACFGNDCGSGVCCSTGLQEFGACSANTVCPPGVTQFCGTAIGTSNGCPAGQACLPNSLTTMIAAGICGPAAGQGGSGGASGQSGTNGAAGPGGSGAAGADGSGAAGQAGSGAAGLGGGGGGTTDGGGSIGPCSIGLGILPNATPAMEVDVQGSPPTPMGGTIETGNYSLTTYTVYGGSPGAQTFEATSSISGGEVDLSGAVEPLSVTTIENDEGSVGLMSQGSYPSTGPDQFGQFSPSCVGTSNIWSPNGFSYTATSMGLTIYVSGPNGSTLAFGFKYVGD